MFDHQSEPESRESSMRSPETTPRPLADFVSSFGAGAEELLSWHVLNASAREHATRSMYTMMSCHRALAARGLSERKISELMGLPKTTLRRQVGLMLKSKDPGSWNILERSGWWDEDPKTYAVDISTIPELESCATSIEELAQSSNPWDVIDRLDESLGKTTKTSTSEPTSTGSPTMSGLGFIQYVVDEGAKKFSESYRDLGQRVQYFARVAHAYAAWLEYQEAMLSLTVGVSSKDLRDDFEVAFFEKALTQHIDIDAARNWYTTLDSTLMLLVEVGTSIQHDAELASVRECVVTLFESLSRQRDDLREIIEKRESLDE